MSYACALKGNTKHADIICTIIEHAAIRARHYGTKHMTYCLAIKLQQGMVFASDSRTHAGVDNINIYSKMHSFAIDDERYFVLLSAGNLATTQAVVNMLQRDLSDIRAKTSFANIKYMFDAAEYVGKVSRKVQNDYAPQQQAASHAFGASFILGGQIKGAAPELFMVYPEGNYIAVSQDNPFLQIGETKYGKPILDRIITAKTPLMDAARCALVSIDSTMRSNLSVGPPIEMLIVPKDTLTLPERIVFEDVDEYLQTIRESWSEGLKRAFASLPKFDWEA